MWRTVAGSVFVGCGYFLFVGVFLFVGHSTHDIRQIGSDRKSSIEALQ